MTRCQPTGGRQSRGYPTAILVTEMAYPHIHNRVETISSKPLWIAKITMIKEKRGGVVAEVIIWVVDVDDF